MLSLNPRCWVLVLDFQLLSCILSLDPEYGVLSPSLIYILSLGLVC